MSNKQALDIFLKHRPQGMTHLLLAHLSKDNNSPELAQQLFEQHAGKVEIVVAGRYEETAVYHITGTPQAAPVIMKARKISRADAAAAQYTLF